MPSNALPANHGDDIAPAAVRQRPEQEAGVTSEPPLPRGLMSPFDQSEPTMRFRLHACRVGGGNRVRDRISGRGRGGDES